MSLEIRKTSEIHKKRVDHDALPQLSVFPLPQMVLLPGAVIPLHIFEPRYRQMVAQSLRSDRLLALGYLAKHAAEKTVGVPPVRRIIGVGSIVGYESLRDGRSLILVEGLYRAELLREHQDGANFRTFAARRLIDDETVASSTMLSSKTLLLRELVNRLARVNRKSGKAEQLAMLSQLPTTGGAFADMVAAALLRLPGMKQNLLEVLDPEARIDLVAEHVGRMLSRQTTRADISSFTLN